jgi:excisionase family DNA binding protein
VSAAAIIAKTNAEPKYLTINEAIQRYRCSRAHLYALKNRGLLRLYKLGGRSLISVAEVDNVVAQSVAAE